MMSWSLKKKPSQVAQVDTPRPISARSDSRPRSLEDAPVAMMTACASSTVSSVRTMNGRRVKCTDVASSGTITVPKRSACLRIVSISSGPMIPSTKPG